MFKLVDFRLFFGNLIKNYSRTLCKATSVNNGGEGTIKLNQSVILSSPETFHCLDFQVVRNWLTSSKHFHTKKVIASDPEKRFKVLVDVAFNTLLHPFCSQSDPQTMLLYFTGHGLNIKKIDKQDAESTLSSPNLEDVGISKEDLRPGEEHITPERYLKGGEFVLGERFGYCDLEGLLEPWITALTRSPTTKNKHLVVIADSCFSGILVKDLQKLAHKESPLNQNGCGVTVQSACGSDEVNFVGYFASCFVHFNKPENHYILQHLKRDWKLKSDVEKIGYRHLHLPSPEAATTMPLDKLSSTIDCPTVEFRDLPLTLFQDAGFFKFCFIHFFQLRYNAAYTSVQATEFLSQRKFEIVDFKLKITRHCTPLALFLVRDAQVSSRFVSVQIHFQPRETSLDRVTKVSLVSYDLPNNSHREILGNVVFEDNLAPSRVHISNLAITEQLVKQCKDYVDATQRKKYPVSWSDDWNMTDSYWREEAIRMNGRFAL